VNDMKDITSRILLAMNPAVVSDRRLIRYLHGELPPDEVRQLRAALAQDPTLQARLQELHRLWQGIHADPPTPAPFGFVPKLQRLADERRAAAASTAMGWGAAPPWARALAGAALLAGVAIGVGLGRLPLPPPPGVGVSPSMAGVGAPEPRATATATATASAAPGAATAQSAGVEAPPIEVAEAAFGDAAPLAGSATLAEEYWQALAGSDDEGAPAW
jgi:hypothetical protein